MIWVLPVTVLCVYARVCVCVRAHWWSLLYSRTIAPAAICCWLYPTLNKHSLIFYINLSYCIKRDILDKRLAYVLVHALLCEYCAHGWHSVGCCSTVYPKKYAHGFVVLCFVVVTQSFIMNSHEVFIHIHQGCFAGTGAIARLPQCQWSKPGGYGKISQCITTTKHSKAKTVCIFLGIYCIHRSSLPITLRFTLLALGDHTITTGYQRINDE